MKMLIILFVYLIQILYTYVFSPCQATSMKKVDEASPNIILAGRALLVKMLIILELHDVFGSNLVYLCILTLFSHKYEKGDDASPSIILAGRALLVKLLINLEPHGIFGSNFVYLCVLTAVAPILV